MLDAPAKARILVVEDSRGQREHLVSLLERRGYAVTAAGGGLDALRQIKADPPDVVLLDVMLDDLDGYSVCRWLRLSERTRDIVVIMLTVRTEIADRVEGLHVGADDYLPKPFDDAELDARIFAALRVHAAKQELQRRNSELEAMLTQTERLAMSDEVTGLVNRRRLLDVLRREWATARRYGHPLTCAILDLDHFKRVNDDDGHHAGDIALRRVAEILMSSIREVDVCGRYGGDEFAILFPHTPRERSLIALQRAQHRLHAQRKLWEGAQSELDFSIGVASNEDPTIREPEQLLEAADRALYDAKRAGRGQILLAREGTVRP